jgi:hypothetical protein
MAAGIGLLMRSESFAFRAGCALQLALVMACREAVADPARRVHQLLQPVPLARVNDLLDQARIFTNNNELPGQAL